MARSWGKDVYWNNKRWLRSNYPEGVGVDDKDYLRMDSIPAVKWQSSGGMAHSYGYDRTEEKAEKYKRKGKHRSSYASESSDSDSDSSWLIVSHGGNLLDINNSSKNKN